MAAALKALAQGRAVLLVDDVGRDGEADLLVGADFANAAMVNFLAREGRGLISLALEYQRCDELGLEPIGDRTEAGLGSRPMVFVDARADVTTGISAADRARTIAVAIDPTSRSEDLVAPGHVMVLRASRGGLLDYQGRAEAAVYLAEHAGLTPAAILCQALAEDGSTAKGTELEALVAKHRLEVIPMSVITAICRDSYPGIPLEGDVETRRLMRSVMGHFATGVGLVTTYDEGGAIGTTANAISSVSLRPPLLLVCLAEDSETLAAIHTNQTFAVNFLSAEQREHSDRFARSGIDALAHEVGFAHHEIGVPVLPDAVATIACTVDVIHPAGDHAIVVGEAQAAWHTTEDPDPLLFFRGTYMRIGSAD